MCIYQVSIKSQVNLKMSFTSEQLIESLKQMSEDDRMKILSQFKIDSISDTETVTNETYVTANDFHISSNEKYDNIYKKWVKYEHENFILTAFTQVGKTDEIIKLTNIFLKKNKIVIISADNKISQLNQIYNRFKILIL